jgi:hypothetical protein
MLKSIYHILHLSHYFFKAILYLGHYFFKKKKYGNKIYRASALKELLNFQKV